MTLRYGYTLFAPIYDALVAPFTVAARRRSLALLGVFESVLAQVPTLEIISDDPRWPAAGSGRLCCAKWRRSENR